MCVTDSNLAYAEEMQVQVKCSHQSTTLVPECASFANRGQVLCAVQIFFTGKNTEVTPMVFIRTNI